MFLRFLRFPLCAFIIHRQGVSCVKDVLKANKKMRQEVACLFRAKLICSLSETGSNRLFPTWTNIELKSEIF